ncbi:fungal zinc cluster transcription factor [Cordyceps javanica]|uniref:Fungal zinc cluster transcription factor n=1 Tax=Cordyceps javanica TaxID=43265 RepID=A0A545ULG8_9HYPO|nr:fungal zinc cluster transcription factor [Cordyceps javanica]
MSEWSQPPDAQLEGYEPVAAPRVPNRSGVPVSGSSSASFLAEIKSPTEEGELNSLFSQRRLVDEQIPCRLPAMGGVVGEDPIYADMCPSGGATVGYDVPSAGSTDGGVRRCYSAAPDHMDTVPVGATGIMQLGAWRAHASPSINLMHFASDAGCYRFAMQQDGYEGNAMQVTQDYTTERNTLIDKETTRQPNSPSPAPTLSTIPNTPRAMPPGFEIDGDFGDVQHSSPPSLVTSASVRGRERTGLAERKDECKSTTKMVDNDNPPDFPHSHDATACSNIVVGYDEKTVVPDSTAVSEYDADNSDARTDDVFSHTTRRIYNETREVRERDDMLYDKLDDVERMIASVTSTLSRTNDRLQAMHTKFDDRLEAMHTEILERFDALHEEIASLSAQQEQDDN